MERIANIIKLMVKVSGYSQEQILSKSRIRPLPAIRWFIGDKLIELGYSCSKASRVLNIDHATLLNGRKQIPNMEKDFRWREELDIYNKFTELCKSIN